MKMKQFLKLAIIAIVILTVIWISSLIKCEVLTAKYFDDFEYAYKQNTMMHEEMEYFKVLNCDGNTAEVYYVSKGMINGDVLTFESKNGTWEETYWEAIWSTSGSASDVIYPYWWHFIYGGF